MVIGTKNVDESVEAALTLVEVISDVRGEIGLNAVCTYDNAILLITEISCWKPGRAIFLVQHAAFLEHLKGSVDTAGLCEALF